MKWRIPLLFVLAGCLTVAATTPRAPQASPVHGPALSTIIDRPVPLRNLYTLADQLKLHPPRTIHHVVRTTSPNYPVGHTDQFEVLGEDANKYFTVSASIRYKTPHLYLYVQDGLKLDDAATLKSVQRFETSIYPTDRKLFGTEWTPGVDGDPHITCLLADLRSSSVGGYYSAEDEYPHLVNKYSNQREMIYLNSASTRPGDGVFDSILAHEFQHMIHWHMHPHDNGWLNEGMSMMAEKLNGAPPSGEEGAFLSSPTTQLTAWSADNSPTNYGAAYLYLLYLYDHYGVGMIHSMVADSQYTDLDLVNDVLRKRHITTSADAVFRNWVVANWINAPSVHGGVYAYRDLSGTTKEAHTVSAPFTYTHAIPPYAAEYISLKPAHDTRSLRLNFKAPTTTPAVSAPGTTPFWWSNRDDMSDMRLERTVDLRHVQHATLQFQAWYDVEKTYDYAYIEASTDSGKTWTTLPATDTTTANPFGANYGNGFTGNSKGWRDESVDLTRFAGHRVLLRFEYITDEVYNGQGFLVRNLTIPQIGYTDRFTGWNAKGFLPVFNNTLPLSWSVRAILYTAHGIVVKPFSLSSGKGTLTVDVAKRSISRIVVAVSSTAPKTTVGTPYTLSASNG